MTTIAKNLRRIIWSIFPNKDFVYVSGSIIPPRKRRWCGREFKDNAYYLKSAESEAHRLSRFCPDIRQKRILDIGCGQGRLPIGILRVIGELDYLGLDVDGRSIDWCKQYIQRDHPTFKFQHLNLFNERYNQNGGQIDGSFRFEIGSGSIDIVYLYSVFSHTTENDMKIYLKEFSRILADNGKVFFTTFIEENVPNISINPENYHLKCSGPLHIVRYQKGYLFSILDQLGYAVLNFTHGTETDGQSAVYLSKKSG